MTGHPVLRSAVISVTLKIEMRKETNQSSPAPFPQNIVFPVLRTMVISHSTSVLNVLKEALFDLILLVDKKAAQRGVL